MPHGKELWEVEQEVIPKTNGFTQEVTAELVKKVALVADLLTIKMNDLHPWYETGTTVLSDTTAEVMYSKRVRVAHLVVLTHVSFGEATSQPTTQEIAIERGGEVMVLNRDKTSAIDITLDWDGQAIMTEGDRVKCTSYGGTSANVLTWSASGYEIKA